MPQENKKGQPDAVGRQRLCTSTIDTCSNIKPWPSGNTARYSLARIVKDAESSKTS